MVTSPKYRLVVLREDFIFLDLNQCNGGLGRFLTSELNQGSVDLKFSLPAVQWLRRCDNAKVNKCHIKNYQEIIPGNLQKSLENSLNFVITKNGNPDCLCCKIHFRTILEPIYLMCVLRFSLSLS